MNIENLVSFFQDVPLLENIEKKELINIANAVVIRDFEKGKTVFYEDDKGTSLYIIISGSVKITIYSDDGREHVIGYLKEKDFFGELSLIDGQPRSTSIIALDKLKVITLSRDNFLSLLKSNPEIISKIITSLCKKIRQTDSHISDLAFLTAPGRVARQLLRMAEDTGIVDGNSIRIEHNLTRQEMANISNTTRETLTRIVMSFQDDGIISNDKNIIIIHDKLALKERVI
jgi:CRP/FNR family cyclic AMP-dependent transcriptional regulator